MFIIKLCLVLLMAVAVNAIGMQDCERKYMDDDIKKYGETIRENWSYCNKMKLVLKLMVSSPNCHGLVVTAYRLWVLQFVYMDNALSPTCGEGHKLPTEPLKNLVMQSPYLSAELKDLPSLEYDGSQPCAKEVHERCLGNYLKDTTKQDFCEAIDNIDNCYINSAKNCKAKILQDYVAFLKMEGVSLIPIYRKYLPDVCK